MAQNDRLSDQNKEIFDQRTDKLSPEAQKQQQAEATASRTQTLSDAVSTAPPAGEIPLSGSAPDIVKSEVAKKMSDTIQFGKDQAKALGAAGGYGDTWFGNSLDTAGAGRDIGVNNNFATGNLGILPYAQDFAQIEATKPMGMLPGIMMGAGNALGSFAGGMPMGGPIVKAPVKKPPLPHVQNGWLY
jgi:hypothetical protein